MLFPLYQLSVCIFFPCQVRPSLPVSRKVYCELRLSQKKFHRRKESRSDFETRLVLISNGNDVKQQQHPILNKISLRCLCKKYLHKPELLLGLDRLQLPVPPCPLARWHQHAAHLLLLDPRNMQPTAADEPLPPLCVSAAAALQQHPSTCSTSEL